MSLSVVRVRFVAGHLQAAMGVAAAFIEQRTTIPILACVLIKADMTGGQLFGTDLEAMVSVPFAAAMDGGRAVSVACDAYQLRRILNTIPSGTPLELVIEPQPDKGQKVFLSWPGCQYRLITQDAAAFPFMESGMKPAMRPQLTFEASAFRAALGAVSACISTEETRYYLNGAAFVHIDGQTQLVATDGHKLAWGTFGARETEAIHRGGAVASPILPRFVVSRILRSKGLQPESLTFGDDAKTPLVRIRCAGGILILAKLIDGSFPDVTRVIPKRQASDISVSVDRAALRASLRRMRAAMPPDQRGVVFTFEKTALFIGPDGGGELQGTAERVCAIEGPETPFEIGFNAGYLMTVLDQVQRQDSAALTFRMKGPAAPVFFAGERVNSVLMPRQVTNAGKPPEAVRVAA